MIAGLVLFGAGLLVAGLAPSMPVLVGGRVLQGIGAGAAPAVAYVCIGPRVPARAAAAGVRPELDGVAAAVADRTARSRPSLGATVGWRWVFLGLIPLAAVIGALALPGGRPARTAATQRRRSAPRRPGPRCPRVRDPGCSSPARTAEARSSSCSWCSARCCCLAALRRLTPPGTLRVARGQPAAIALRGFGTFAFFSIDAYITLALVNGRHTSTWIGGGAADRGRVHLDRWLVAPGPLGRALRPSTARRRRVLADRRVGGAVRGGAVPGVPYELAFLAWGLGGFGMGLSYSSISAATLARAEPGREGAADQFAAARRLPRCRARHRARRRRRGRARQRLPGGARRVADRLDRVDRRRPGRCLAGGTPRPIRRPCHSGRMSAAASGMTVPSHRRLPPRRRAGRRRLVDRERPSRLPHLDPGRGVRARGRGIARTRRGGSGPEAGDAADLRPGADDRVRSAPPPRLHDPVGHPGPRLPSRRRPVRHRGRWLRHPLDRILRFGPSGDAATAPRVFLQRILEDSAARLAKEAERRARAGSSTH